MHLMLWGLVTLPKEILMTNLLMNKHVIILYRVSNSGEKL